MIEQAIDLDTLKKDNKINKPPGLQLPQLTFTRFIAAISIAIYHFKGTVFPFTIESVDNVVKYFNVFVSYFFVLSGFILVISGSDKLGFKKFYINRFARIYPLYLFALVVTLLLVYNARTPKDTVSFDKVFVSAFLIQSWFKNFALIYNFPAWSLAVEAFFYLLFPAVIYTFRNVSLKTEILIIGATWVIMQCFFIWMLTRGNYFVIYHPIFHVSTFLLGTTAGKLFRAKQSLLKTNLKKLGYILAIILLTIFYLVFSKNNFFFQYYPNGLLAPAFILAIYIIALSKAKFFAIFKNKDFQYLGEISYGIYILQVPVSIAVFGIIDRTMKFSQTTTFYIYLVMLIITSAITYELIEKPFRKNIKKLLLR